MFKTGNDDAMTVMIDSKGNVGIGTMSPSSPLTVHGTGTAMKPQVKVYNGSKRLNLKVDEFPVASIYAFDDMYQQFLDVGIGGESGNAVRITPFGNVGIGTNSPISRLQVVMPPSVSGPTVGLNVSGNTSDVTMSLSNSSSGGSTWFINSTANGSGIGAGKLTMGHGAWTSVLTLTNTGNVGIGTSNPQAKLEVMGSAIFKGPASASPQDGELMYDSTAKSYRYYDSSAAGWRNIMAAPALISETNVTSNMGSCTVPGSYLVGGTQTPTNYSNGTSVQVNCQGLPASTMVAVSCSIGSAITVGATPPPAMISARATGTANMIAITVNPNLDGFALHCMWMTAPATTTTTVN